MSGTERIPDPFGHFLARIIQDNDITKVDELEIHMGKILGRSKPHKDIWDFIVYCNLQSGEFPDRDALAYQKYTKIPEDSPYPLEVLINASERRYAITKATEAAASKNLNGMNLDDVLGTLKELSDNLLDVISDVTSMHSIDLRDSEALYRQFYVESTKSTRLKLGWESYDRYSLGMKKGELVSVSGRPGAGKTWVAIKCAHSMWKQGAAIMFVTMEMDVEAIFDRVLALETKVPAKIFSSYQLTDWNHKSVFDAMENLKHSENPFRILGAEIGNDIDSILAEIRKHRPDVVVVDGAYMLDVSKDNKYMAEHERVGKAAMILKRTAMDCGIPMIASWQMNRAATTVKKEQISLEHIAGSDKIGQVSSSVLLVSHVAEEEASGGDTRSIKILKGRNGETGTFNIAFDMVNMNMDEVETPHPWRNNERI